MMDFGVVKAVFWKDFRSHLSNPTGYVFLTLFIAVTAAAAFVQEEFFVRNLADLALLNRYMPLILMFFVPALTMGVWAEEKRSGTDELLLTLPARDSEVILGKYLGALAMYSVALAFSLAHIFVLVYLGEPDPGLMASTYFGYWLMGVLLVAVGLLGSMLVGNATGGFVAGVIGCSALVFADVGSAGGLLATLLLALLFALAWLVINGDVRGCVEAGAIGAALGLGVWLTGIWPGFVEFFEKLSIEQHFASFGEGVIRLGDLIFFAAGAALVLYLCGLLLGRRHW